MDRSTSSSQPPRSQSPSHILPSGQRSLSRQVPDTSFSVSAPPAILESHWCLGIGSSSVRYRVLDSSRIVRTAPTAPRVQTKLSSSVSSSPYMGFATGPPTAACMSVGTGSVTRFWSSPSLPANSTTQSCLQPSPSKPELPSGAAATTLVASA